MLPMLLFARFYLLLPSCELCRLMLHVVDSWRAARWPPSCSLSTHCSMLALPLVSCGFVFPFFFRSNPFRGRLVCFVFVYLFSFKHWISCYNLLCWCVLCAQAARQVGSLARPSDVCTNFCCSDVCTIFLLLSSVLFVWCAPARQACSLALPGDACTSICCTDICYLFGVRLLVGPVPWLCQMMCTY